MASSIRLTIGGREYSLLGEDEKLTRQAATKVNETLDNIAGSHSDIADKTLMVLAALNLAEEKIIAEENQDKFSENLNTELSKLAEYVNEAFK